MINTLTELNNNLFFAFHGLIRNSEIFDFLIYFIAERIDLYVLAIGVLFIAIHTHKHHSNHPRLISRRSIKEGLFIIIAVLIAWGISYLLKIGFAIPRPFLQFPDLAPLFPYGGYNSFPSGHATLFAALGTTIYLNHKKVGILFTGVAILIGLSRIIAGVHFPIDILAGWALGLIVSYLVYKYLIKMFR